MILYRSFLFSFVLACSFPVLAGQFQDLERDFGDALKEDSVYDGEIVWGTEGEGTFCDTFTEGLLDFKMVLDDVKVDIDENGVVSFHIMFKESATKLRYEYQNGVLCRPLHVRGDILTGALEANLKLIPSENPTAEEAKIRIPHLKIESLKFEKVFVGSGDHEVGGDAPQWLNQWIETNFNQLMAKFLKTKVSERLTDYLIEHLESRLRDRRRDAPRGPLLPEPA